MTPRERFFAALAGEMPDKLPLTIWNNKLPGGGIDEQLLALEVCIINKSSVWKVDYSGMQVNVREEQQGENESLRFTKYKTPKGNLQLIERVFPHTTWIEKFPFTSDSDYDAMAYLFEHREYLPDHDSFLADDTRFGDSSLARPKSIHTPMHELIYEYMGIEAFCHELAENFDKVIDICRVLEVDCLKRVAATAKSPAKYAVIDGNTQIDIIGISRFEQYYVPYIEKACAMLHDNGKYAGSHLDGNNSKLAHSIKNTSLDFIEAFTPPPECDLPLSEARKIWSGKSILVNFPSSLHLFPLEDMQAAADDILAAAAPGNRFSIGVTEDVPNRGVHTILPLFTYLRQKGQYPLPKDTKGKH